MPSTGVPHAAPMFLLADSKLLFEPTFLKRIADALPCPPAEARAAYLGASNGDVPFFYEIFRSAMDRTGIPRRLHVHAQPNTTELAHLAQADLIVLAGGEPELGWRAFERAGVVEIVRARRAAGAVLLGVSAGAMQLGTVAEIDSAARFFAFVPYAIGPHEEPEWSRLVKLVESGRGQHRGLGIPSGAAAIVDENDTIEPVGHALTDVAWTAAGAQISALSPPPRRSGQRRPTPRE